MLTIGQVAATADVSTDALRFYEREGLIRPVKKTRAGYRLYEEDAVRRLHFIKHAQQCGFSLADIRELLELKNRNRSCCNNVKTVAIDKRRELETKISALQAMAYALTELIDVCTDESKPLDECPILAALETSMTQQKSQTRPTSRELR